MSASTYITKQASIMRELYKCASEEMQEMSRGTHTTLGGPGATIGASIGLANGAIIGVNRLINGVDDIEHSIDLKEMDEYNKARGIKPQNLWKSERLRGIKRVLGGLGIAAALPAAGLYLGSKFDE